MLISAGIILPFGSSSIPSGYLLCDGSAVSRTTYATLFSVIGTTYGAGDGSTTFNIPDLRGRGVAQPTLIVPYIIATTSDLTASSLTFNSTSGIIGTTTNNNAAAGSVGEYVSNSLAIGSEITLTTVTQTNITSISLTAGDWDVEGTVAFDTGSTTVVSSSIASVSSTSATLGAVTDGGYANGGTSHNAVVSTGSKRFSLSTTTTIYLVAYSSFTTSTQKAYGAIRARRVR